MPIVGNVPVHYDPQSGEVFVDPADAQVGDIDDVAESGRVYWPFGKRARGRRQVVRAARRGYAAPEVAEESPADLYQAAAAQGMVQENQFNGLGYASIAAASSSTSPGSGTIENTVNRNMWAKSIVLDSDAPSQVLVTAITIAGLPIQIGTEGAPLSMFATNSTRFGISFGRKLALVGQEIQVTFNNIDTSSAHTATGGVIADEMNPFAMQRLWERMLLTAAVEYDGRF